MARQPKPWYRGSRGAYYVEIDGKQVKLAAGPKNAETHARATLAFHQLMAEILSNPPADGGNPTVASIADEHLEYAKRRDAEKTLVERTRLLQDFCDVYGPMYAKDLKGLHLTKWVDSHDGWESEWTKSYAIRIVKRAFNWATKMGLIPESPFRCVELPECGRTRRPMTEEEYATLLAAAGPESRFAEVLRFLCLTGCRPGELTSIQWSEVDLESEYPRVVQEKHKTSRRRRKTKLPRTIFLVPEVVELLITMQARGDHPQYVFVSQRNQPWAHSSLQQRLRRLRRKIGLPEDVVLYYLRHKFGTDSVRRGNDLKTTGDLMGHASARTTEQYVYFAQHPDCLANAMIRATKSG